MKKMTKYILMFMLSIALCSCKKTPKENQKKEPEKLPFGTAIGTPVLKAIGPEGGTISFPDGRMSLTVPAGALKTSTNFSITNSTATSPFASGTSYKIMPEGIKFEKPVVISFKYDENDVKNSNVDFLYLGYQDQQGYYHILPKTQIDRINKTLSVQTTHFSHWTILRSFAIQVDNASLGANESTGVKVTMIDNWVTSAGNGISDDDYLLLPAKLSSDEVVGWKVIGEGKVTNNKKLVEKYTAPVTIDVPKTAEVEVTVKGVVDAAAPDRPGTKGIAIVKTTLNLLPNHFMTWTVDGKEFTAKVSNGVQGGNQLVLSGIDAPNICTITITNVKKGVFPFGKKDEPDKAVFVAGENEKLYATEILDCNSQTQYTMQGEVTIEQYGNVGENIVGRFAGKAYYRDNCTLLLKDIKGAFKVRRAM